MMGELQSGREQLFYAFDLEDHIPQNHLLHGIDRVLDLNALREAPERHRVAIFSMDIYGRPPARQAILILENGLGHIFGVVMERRDHSAP